MDIFKIENWKKDNKFIDYVSLSTSEIQEKIQEIAKLCNLDFDNIYNNSLFSNTLKVLHTHIVIQDINEPNTFYQILPLIKNEISMETHIYLIWDYDSVDKIKLSCLAKYWDYIWYGPSDEMVLLFIPEIQLILLVAEYGVVYY
jgi:hypothetical protein